METANISELRNRLPEYLSRAAAGRKIEATRRGEVIARILPAQDKRRVSKAQLAALRAQAAVGDVVSPVAADWESNR